MESQVKMHESEKKGKKNRLKAWITPMIKLQHMTLRKIEPEEPDAKNISLPDF